VDAITRQEVFNTLWISLLWIYELWKHLTLSKFPKQWFDHNQTNQKSC
jgi:hypothetical protein